MIHKSWLWKKKRKHQLRSVMFVVHDWRYAKKPRIRAVMAARMMLGRYMRFFV